MAQQPSTQSKLDAVARFVTLLIGVMLGLVICDALGILTIGGCPQ